MLSKAQAKVLLEIWQRDVRYWPCREDLFNRNTADVLIRRDLVKTELVGVDGGHGWNLRVTPEGARVARSLASRGYIISIADDGDRKKTLEYINDRFEPGFLFCEEDGTVIRALCGETEPGAADRLQRSAHDFSQGLAAARSQ